MRTSAVITHNFDRPRHTPAKLDELTRKKRKLTSSLDLLTSELPALKKRRDEAAAISLDSGSPRARRQYDNRVKELAEKAGERDHLQHAIASVDVQLREERQRLEAEKQKRDADREADHREKCIQMAMGIRQGTLQHRQKYCHDEHERKEVELQLKHLREIAELEYDDEAKMRKWKEPKPCKMLNGMQVSDPNRLKPPETTPMFSDFGLPPRPLNLGGKK